MSTQRQTQTAAFPSRAQAEAFREEIVSRGVPASLVCDGTENPADFRSVYAAKRVVVWHPMH